MNAYLLVLLDGGGLDVPAHHSGVVHEQVELVGVGVPPRDPQRRVARQLARHGLVQLVSGQCHVRCRRIEVTFDFQTHGGGRALFALNGREKQQPARSKARQG